MPADQDKEAEKEKTMFEMKSQIGDREGGRIYGKAWHIYCFLEDLYSCTFTWKYTMINIPVSVHLSNGDHRFLFLPSLFSALGLWPVGKVSLHWQWGMYSKGFALEVNLFQKKMKTQLSRIKLWNHFFILYILFVLREEEEIDCIEEIYCRLSLERTDWQRISPSTKLIGGTIPLNHL